MANTLTEVSSVDARRQFQGMFSRMYQWRGTIDDQDAVAATDSAEFDVTVTGLLLGDMVLFWSSTLDFSDGTDQAIATMYVSAADTLTIQFQADVAEFAADAMNAAVIRAVIARPNW